ncbi:MAG: SRPBCC family protein [Rudaea sp.]|uniref:SRPBCC family protein n=1 Tax=Rudaea sp. TaxID=2136325 RepID=UPI0039E3DAE9
MSEAIESVISEVTVPLSLNDAFELFTTQFGRWWPRDYSYSREVLDTIVLGNGQGQWCYERGPHGFRCDWGRIIEWAAPAKLVFTWQVGPKSIPQPNPNNASLVTVRLAERSAGQTIVTVEHSDFAKHGEGAVQYRDEMASEYGWSFILQQYVAAAKQR